MPRNVEIKAKVKDMTQVEAKAASMATEDPATFVQRDVFFRCPEQKNRLKLRYLEGKPAQLIRYSRADQEGPKTSDYDLYHAQDPQQLEKALTSALGTRGEVAKTRTLVMVGRTRVHLDRVRGLGEFAELEVVLEDDEAEEEGVKEAEELMEKLGIDKADLVKGAYLDLILAKNES